MLQIFYVFSNKYLTLLELPLVETNQNEWHQLLLQILYVFSNKYLTLFELPLVESNQNE